MQRVISLIKSAIIGTIFEDKTFIVGGYVRDHILGKNSRNSDLDIVVNMENGGIKLAEYLYKRGISSFPVIYKKFGTSYVKIDDVKIELVMTRSESYRNKDRKPDVKHANLIEDAFRRDFTINSLMMNIITDEIHDLTGKGISDIKKNLIRTTSDPEIIFHEDPLRILRAVRFANKLGFGFEAKTAENIIANAKYLNDISAERKRDEFSKILLSSFPAKGMKMLVSMNIMNFLIPESYDLIGLEQNKYHSLNAWDHTLEVLKNTKADLHLRLAALLHDIGKSKCFSQDEKGIHFYNHEKVSAEMSKKILRRLKYSNETIKVVSILIKNHMRFKQSGENGEKITEKTLRKIILQLGENLASLLDLVQADNISHKAEYKLPEQIAGIIKRVTTIENQLQKDVFPLSGEDVMNYFGLSEGKQIGKMITAGRELWLYNPLISKREILEKLKQEFYD